MTRHPLLLDERPLLILPELATRLGLNEAILLQQVHYWLVYNRQHHHNFREGRFWMYNTLQAWQQVFPFWSRNTIRRAIESLEQQKVLLARPLSKDPRDRTLWYTIDYEALHQLLPRNEPPVPPDTLAEEESATETNAIAQPGQMQSPKQESLHRPNPGTWYSEKTTERTPENNNTSGCSKRAGLVVALCERLVESGITRGRAEVLAAEHPPEVIERQLAALSYREAKEPPAVLVQAIREDWALPAAYHLAQAEKEQQRRKRIQREAKRQQAKEAVQQQACREVWFASLPSEQQRALEQEALRRFQHEQPFLAARVSPSVCNPAAEATLSRIREELISEQCPADFRPA